MRSLLIALAFASIIPALHTLYNYPWRDSYLVTTITFALLVAACGYVFGCALLLVVGEKREETPAPVEPDHKSGVGMVTCPYCQTTGRRDYFIYGEEYKHELFQRECDQCGCIYTSIRTKV